MVHLPFYRNRGTSFFLFLNMLLSLLLIPILGLFSIVINKDNELSVYNIKLLALVVSTLNLFISLVIFILFDFSTNQFQFVQEYHEISYYDFYLGIDGLSIYFTLLTTLIIPIALVSNWNSIKEDVDFYVTIILLLESLLLVVFLILDILLFYIFFESILPPLFILIGIFGSDNRVKASFYLFLYTLLGSLFLLLSILAMSSIMSTTDYDTLFKGNFIYLTQLFLFYGIFIAFAVKTPTIFLNTWLLKAHVESPLGGSIILAAIVLKLSLYGILRLILPILPKAYILYTYIIFLIGVITIIYASLSTVRTIDVKELIAYSSVSHAAVYLLGVFSNTIQGIEGAINLGLAHGLVSPGLFISAGGVLYDRSSTRVISFYRGVTQVMPLFSILFFLLCLANCGAPLSLNFVGEFLSLYGVFERSSLFGVFASSSIIFSAAYTIYMYQRIAFGGVYSRMFIFSIPDLTKREFTVLLALVVPTVLFGIYPAVILDAVHYSVSTLIYSVDSSVISCDSSMAWEHYFQNNASFYHSCFAISFWIAVLTIAIKNKDIVKSLIYKWGRLIFYLILGSFSLSTFILIMYAIYMLYVSYCIITEAIFNGLFTSHHAEHYCIATEMDSELIEKNSLFVKGRDNVFLTSTGDQSSNPTGNHVGVQGPQPTGNVQAQGPQPTGNVQAQGTQPTGNVQAQGWHRLETPVRWMDQDGYIQTRFWIDPQGEYRLIGPGPHRPHVPWPPREWEPVGGQGDNPVYFTKARQGEELTHRNTFNTREGYINYCESKRGDHRWSTVDTHNLEENNGFCFNCREKTRNMHYSCWNCYRHVCTRCDSTYDMHAFRNFTDRMNDWTKNEIKKPRSR